MKVCSEASPSSSPVVFNESRQAEDKEIYPSLRILHRTDRTNYTPRAEKLQGFKRQGVKTVDLKTEFLYNVSVAFNKFRR